MLSILLMTRRTDPDCLRGRQVTLMGLGSFGGGVGALRFLLDQQANVIVTDLQPATEFERVLQEFRNEPDITWHLGGHEEGDFHNVDLVVVNPAVPDNSPYLAIARKQGVPLTSELGLFWERNPARVIAVTGSNGKSTTAALIHAILKVGGLRCWLGGNIGRSLLTDLSRIDAADWVVLEVSSFQWIDLDRQQARPNIAVVTNVTPNHLDRHGTFEDYCQAKQAILRWQTPEDHAILNQDDPIVSQWPAAARCLWFGATDRGRLGLFGCESGVVARLEAWQEPLPLRDWLRLPGRHNLRNAQAAACAALIAGASIEDVRHGLESFHGLPHRLEPVGEVGGRCFVDDSLATTPESALAALQSFAQPIVLLAGGYDKRVDLDALAAGIANHAKAVALMGQTAPRLAQRLDQMVSDRTIDCHCCRSLDDAFQWAVDHSVPGDVILLSPGCASYDWFRNFAERGERFKELVSQYRAGWHTAAAPAPDDRLSQDL